MESRFDISAGELKMKLEAKCIKEEKVEDIPKLTLAPFTNNTKLFFENSLIGTTSIQQLIIENPTTQDVKVAIKNMPPSEKRVQLSWEVQNIPACAAVLWEITWMPDIVDSWRHTFSFQFGRCLKKDLPVTFKSVANKKQVNPKNRSSVKVPTRHSSVTAPHCSINNKKVNGSSYVTSISKKSTVRAQKENIPKVVYSNLNEDDVFLPSKYTSFTLESFNSEIRRETYTVKERQCSNDHNISVDSIDMCLENNKYYGTASDTLALKVKDLVFSPLGDSKYLANLSTATYTKENRLNSASSLSELGQRIYSTSSIEEELHNISTATYTKDSLHSKYNPIEDLHNISSGTYTKERQPAFSLNDSNLTNISTATYTKEKYLYSISPNADSLKGISSETYTKEALSTEKSKVMNGIIKQSSPICTKKSVWFSESLLGSHENDNIPSGFNFSPISFDTPNVHQKNMSGMGVRTIIEANLWGCENVSGYITNDALITKPLKRKSELNFEISPAKRVHINGQLSNEPHNLNWNTSKPPRVKVKSDGFYFDPYMVQSVYQDEAWMERQEGIFKNWLNALLAPPSELDVNVEVNVAKIWQESKQKGESAPTPLSKESVSSTYHTNHRLDALRKSASELFRSQAVGKVIATTYQIIENQKLSIRQDKNIHLNLGLQSQITLVLLNYNPLWLRIGLETLFNTIIPISSNSDVMGLHNYIMQNLFKSSFLLQKFKSAHSPKYVAAIQKFILKKLFALVYFLDVAKTTTLIPHDPCLFSKTSPIKESREVVLTFSRELLSSVGDITKVLRLNGYILNHKQKYIHEFDYCVNHLGADLRDGVRLTRVMELILLKTGLTDLLRVPAVSRLQKIHNMKGVFDALTDAGFEILGDISPKDIVDGHHEKTLSFLWQIIYKFQAPVMVKAANTIIKWWRSLQIVVKRRIIQKRRHRLDTAAICIQTWYRRLTLAWKIEQLVPVVKQILLERLCNNSALKIQFHTKGFYHSSHTGEAILV
ncbi:protein abnormal spindle-like [Photinus pyralis]|uniref:protein abnormal spindle-like n=1 Tax=Photinus pyralis TaxID=7054 RepID=UPI001267185B|nr:protein abnormal spindle-like [Photinus pyralis]